MRKSFLLLCAAAAMISLVGPAYAQPDAGAKMRGEYNFYGGSGSSAMRSASDYSRNYHQYAESVKTVNPEVAREAADSIGQYITKAQKHMAAMRKHAAGDKDALAALDSIDKNLAAAKKSHAEMHETCLKDNVDGAATMKCCQVIDDSLAKAISEHDKLMKRLAADKTPVTRK